MVLEFYCDNIYTLISYFHRALLQSISFY